jgi:hypothetical protein
VWSVGYQYGCINCPYYETLVIHWNGMQWAYTPSEDPGYELNSFSDVVAVAGSPWTVGYYSDSWLDQAQTLVEENAPCPPPCPNERFHDLCPGDPFYDYVLPLADDGIFSGYSTVPPCPNSLWAPCFNSYGLSTRGQIAKVVSLAADLTGPVTTQSFEDVPPGSIYFTYIERMAERGIISGYPCGSRPSEPCVPPGNRPYFRTNKHVTRGQICKIVANAFNWTDPVTTWTFQDVPPGSTFFTYIGRLYARGIVSGYPCGGQYTCLPPENRPYFRYGDFVMRGQTAKIVQLTRTQPTPTPTSTITAIPTSSSTPDLTVTPTTTTTAIAR